MEQVGTERAIQERSPGRWAIVLEVRDEATGKRKRRWVRDTPLLIPSVLAVLCGLRRGGICALRWRSVDLVSGQISVVEALEQTKAGLRFKSPKSGKGRTVAFIRYRA
jgi:integrase